MEIRISPQPWGEAETDWLIVGISEQIELSGQLAELDRALGGLVTRVREQSDCSGKLGELLAIHAPRGIKAKRLLLVGLGILADLDRSSFEKAMMTALRHISTKSGVSAAVALPESLGTIETSAACETIAIASIVAPIGQDLLKTEPGHFELAATDILVPQSTAATAGDAARRGMILGGAINLTRELVNLPPQTISPEVFAVRAGQVAAELGLHCDILDQSRLEAERMGSMLAVAQGSTRPPRLVVMEYRGAGEGSPALALVGKGVTFDSGGLSIKTTESMLTMKCDMAGAATVLGAITAIARLKLKVNVVGYMGLVENMISGSSYKLGDILKARNGTTIEVQNTDAEGRLVLCDVLSYAVDRGADRIIDLATLTGACVVALGEDVAGAFANNQAWCDQVLAAARATGESVWQLPMWEFYNELLKSDVADVRNIGGRWGGAITAAKFLEKFVGGKPWVHLDIAGPAFASSNKPHREGGATGAMLRTLVEAAASS